MGKNTQWVALWYDTAGKRRSKRLGAVTGLSKAHAREQLAALVGRVNEERRVAPITLRTYVETSYLAYYRRVWKESTTRTNVERLQHLLPVLGHHPVTALTRAILQDYLDSLASEGLGHSVISHLRWDLRSIGRMCHLDGLIPVNWAERLHVPEAPVRERHILTTEQLQRLITELPAREVLLVRLCGQSGLRPGEAVALRWKDVTPDGLVIERRLYRGVENTPKSRRGYRVAAMNTDTEQALAQWKALSPYTAPEDWIFPSEKRTTAVWPTNIWWDRIRPVAVRLGLDFANFQVLRRSAVSALAARGVSPIVIAQQMGHGLQVSVGTYTVVTPRQKRAALDQLESDG